MRFEVMLLTLPRRRQVPSCRRRSGGFPLHYDGTPRGYPGCGWCATPLHGRTIVLSNMNRIPLPQPQHAVDVAARPWPAGGEPGEWLIEKQRQGPRTQLHLYEEESK